MPGCLEQLWQCESEFVPRYRFLRVWIQASVAHGTVGGIAHHGAECAGGEKRRNLADVTLDDVYAVFQAITHHILSGEHG
jgi:hypothetical protein